MFIIVDPVEDVIISQEVLPAGGAMVQALVEIKQGYEVIMFEYDEVEMPPASAVTYDLRTKRSIQ